VLIKTNQIENLPCEASEDEYALQQKDVSLFTINPQVELEGNILVLKLTKDLETSVHASVDRKSLNLFGYFEIDNAFSNKDDFFVAKKIRNLLSVFDGEYTAITVPQSNRWVKEVSILLVPTHLVPADTKTQESLYEC